MSDRQQLVKIGEVLSRSEVIESGVPQGSVLGPIGFLIYINDLGKINLHGRIIFFADDACLLYDSDKLDDLYMYMKQDIEILMKWFSNNLLLLNLKKTEYVIFHKRSIIVEKRDLYVNNILITNTNIVRYLGLTLDDTLSWKAHIDSVRKSVLPGISLLFRLRNFISTDCLKMLYYALIHSRITYLAGIWGHCKEVNFNQIFILQKRALKTVYKLPVKTGTQHLFNVSGVAPLKLLVNATLACFVHRSILNGMHLEIFVGKKVPHYHLRTSINLPIHS